MKRIIATFIALLAPIVFAEEHEIGPDGWPLPANVKRDREPVWLLKFKLMPLLGGIASSAVSGNLDHGFALDYERFLSPQTSLSGSIGHNRLTVGAEKDSLGLQTVDFIEEFQLGGYYTFYHTPFFKRGRTYFRVGAYLMLLAQDSPVATATKAYFNLARSGLAIRAVFEYGTSFKLGESGVMELGAGLSAYLSNPYDANSGRGLAGTPLWIRNILGGVADFYPYLNVSAGFAFF